MAELKFWRVERTDEVGWDEYDEWAVVAESADHAIRLVVERYDPRSLGIFCTDDEDGTIAQQILRAIEVGDEPGIVADSFHSG